VPFASLQDGFERAKTTGEVHQFAVRFAEFPVLVSIIGDHWADLVQQSIGHLPRPESTEPIEFRIDAWDAEETGIMPKVPLARLQGPPTVMKTSQDGLFIGEERHHGTLWLDRTNAHVVGCIAGVGTLTLDARARPFHKLLSAWLLDRNVQFVHAGLVSEADKAMLFVGNGGAGKSTASISCLRSGMGYLGDDFVGISRLDNGFVGHGFYASCLLDSHHLTRFPDLAEFSHAPYLPEERKHVVYLQQCFGQSLRHKQPIRAIAMPRIVDQQHSSFEKASKVQALKAIAPTSVMYLPRPSKAAFETLSDLVETVPAFWFNSGRDVDQIGSVVRSFVKQLI
jgi:hypothetical protein